MRLVACNHCRTQLDLTDVDKKSVRCRCGEAVENQEPAARDLEVHRCSACGGSISEDADNCEYCGSEVVRNRHNLSVICPNCFARNAEHDRFCSGCGLGFEPVQVDAYGEELLCPACDQCLSPHVVGDVRIAECPACNGLWIPKDRFQKLMRSAVEAQRKSDGIVVDPFKPRMTGANPASQRVRYRKCLVCKQHMHRQNYEKTSGVIIDLCHEHGTWLDADELERIAGFLLSGGRKSANRAVAEEAESSRRAAEKVAMARVAQLGLERRGRSGFGRAGRDRGDDDAVTTLFRVFTRILD